MSGHVDERGTIQDLFSRIDSVTRITTRKGAVRGNHIHYLTDQWTFVVSGRLLSKLGDGEPQEVGQGTMIFEPKGVPHAWKALETTDCLVFTKGPRSGDKYESDTTRLEVPLLT